MRVPCSAQAGPSRSTAPDQQHQHQSRYRGTAVSAPLAAVVAVDAKSTRNNNGMRHAAAAAATGLGRALGAASSGIVSSSSRRTAVVAAAVAGGGGGTGGGISSSSSSFSSLSRLATSTTTVRPLPLPFASSSSSSSVSSSYPSSSSVAARALSTDAPPAKAKDAKQPAKGKDVAAAAAAVELPTSDESDELLRIRHSCAHIMAMAVQRLKPGAQTTIGPWIERGFYYDFATSSAASTSSSSSNSSSEGGRGEAPSSSSPTPSSSSSSSTSPTTTANAVVTLSDADLPLIKKEMQRIIKAKMPFVREEVSFDEAARRIDAAGEPFKREILEGITAKDPTAPITIYHIGEPGQEGSWWDLCAGPHVASTGDINPNAIDLESVAGAYWRGDENKPQLQRVYGTAWATKEQLKAYGQLKAEAARRDHRKLGTELDLFSIQDATGPGLVLWHPDGAAVRRTIENYWTDVHVAAGYSLLYTPHVARRDLWKTSGHLDFYGENMFESMAVESDDYQLRPMNCPFHIAVYQKKQRSYRDLPMRVCELGTVYRYERSGTMHGLFRVRGFTQDDGHIFCLPEQIAPEIEGVLGLVQDVMGAFGFDDLEVNLSTRPEKAVGSDEIWETAEKALVEALGARSLEFKVDEGGGAFYGPKIDVKVKDALGRKWQCSTIQLDFNLPERFGLEYVSADDAERRKRPIMIHRAIFGSLERFFGILVENYAGAFPLWLAPVQVRLLCVAEPFRAYAEEVASKYRRAGIRARVESGERIAKLIRSAEKAKTPVMCVVGEREAAEGTLAVRTYAGGDAGSMGSGEVMERVLEAVRERRGEF